MLIGTHIQKYPTFITTVQSCDGTFPVQIFTGNTKSWNKPKILDKDIQETIKYVKRHNVYWYIHSIYLINLSRPVNEIISGLFSLLYDLFIGYKIGCRGVVVHCGKYLKMGIQVALNNMYHNIIILLPFIKTNCPLLIETPAGQGTEVLTKMDDFFNFYAQFTPIQQKKIKVCIDTCHVWSAGYNPLEYLKRFYEKFPKSLSLVHYNDSKGPLGCCKDRHEYPGKGCIGEDIMKQVHQWCNERDIPMIMEI